MVQHKENPSRWGNFLYEFGLFENKKAARITQSLGEEAQAHPPNNSQSEPEATIGEFLLEVKETLPAMLRLAKESEETTTSAETKKRPLEGIDVPTTEDQPANATATSGELTIGQLFQGVNPRSGNTFSIRVADEIERRANEKMSVVVGKKSGPDYSGAVAGSYSGSRPSIRA